MKVEFPTDTNETRTVGMPLRKDDFDKVEEINPFTQMKGDACNQGKHGASSKKDMKY